LKRERGVIWGHVAPKSQTRRKYKVHWRGSLECDLHSGTALQTVRRSLMTNKRPESAVSDTIFAMYITGCRQWDALYIAKRSFSQKAVLLIKVDWIAQHNMATWTDQKMDTKTAVRRRRKSKKPAATCFVRSRQDGI
jgi:hypothetical protein